MTKSKLLDNINKYFNTVMAEVKKISFDEKDALRGISYTSEQIEISKKEKVDFLKRFSDFIPKAEKILNENKESLEKEYKQWEQTTAPPKTTTKARAVLYGAVITSIIAALLPILSVFLETYGFVGSTWVAAASVPEIFGGSALLSRYDTMKANINTKFNNWKNIGDNLLTKIQSIDRTIDTMYILKYRIEFYVNDDNIMANEWTFQSIKREAELLMESVLKI
ncbi:MAG: hypothetical protein ACTSPY_09495 [Candidatus Helarchaeota archaeon]